MKLWEFIEYESYDNLLVYKHPCEDFNWHSKLIVREGQTAIFLKNGQVADVFQPGRYVLSTNNLPILGKIMSISTGGESTFSAEIYFISTTNVMNLKWGTNNKIDLQDPLYKIIVKVGACGEVSFKINDAIVFFKTFVGTKLAINNNELINFFRSIINMHIKNGISNAVTKDEVSILEINSNLISLADVVRDTINEIIIKDGICIHYFSLENIVIPDNDISLNKLKESLSKRADMDILGYSYKDEKIFENSRESVSSECDLRFNGVRQQENNNKNQSAIINYVVCSNCKTSNPPVAKFCCGCGQKMERRIFCNACGTELPGGARFCHVCGEKIT